MRCLLLSLCITTVSLYAEYNRTSTLIDVPTAHLLSPMTARFGVSGSYTLQPRDDTHDFDLDFSANFGFPSDIEGSIGVYSGDNVLVFGLAKGIFSNEKWNLAIGIHELSYSMDVSSVGGGDDDKGWDDDVDYNHDDFLKPNENFSIFFVATRNLKKSGELTFGLGRGRYVGYGPHSRYFNTEFYTDDKSQYAIGLILGYELPITPSFSFLIDLDGRDANIGFKYQRRYLEFDLSAVKLEQIGMDDFTPRIAGGLFARFPFVPEKPKGAIVAGVLRDAEKRSVLTGIVSIENSGIPAQNTAPGTGYYKFEQLPAGNYTFVASAQGYEMAKKTVSVKAGQFVPLDFTLVKSKPKLGGLTGNVYDRQSKLPLVADLSLTPAVSLGTPAEKPIAETKSDGTGRYTFKDIPPDAYKLMIEVQDYSDQILDVNIGAGVTTSLDIYMVKKGMVITLKGIKFDFNKATIRPESAPILDEAAAILENNPEILVEIQGHTDNIGSRTYNMKLSQARAQAVVNYLTAIHGIDPNRLTAKGYGFSRPVASNDTEEGRAQNRRVDFVIIR
ncbi:MAG: OmpA family protein [candidate division WOR-3 bacterium]